MTQPLQMVRAEISVRDFQRWMGCEAAAGPGPRDALPAGGVLRRRFVAEAVSGDHPRSGPKGVLYGYGRAAAEELRAAANAYADPLQCRALPADSIDSKPMPTEWQAGSGWDLRCGFDPLCAAPTRRSAGRAGSGTLSNWKQSDTPKEKCPAAVKKSIPIGSRSSSPPEAGRSWMLKEPGWYRSSVPGPLASGTAVTAMGLTR